MEEGMGIIRKNQALSEDLGPGLGRGMGLTTEEKTISHLVGHQPSGHQEQGALPSKRVPGFPQDMWMPMDEAVAKPETQGLPPGWSGALMGMMTLVRVFPPEQYEKIMIFVRQRETGSESRDDIHRPHQHGR